MESEDAFVFSVEMLEPYKKLAEFDSIDLQNEFARFFEPPSLDGRIVNQGAVLSLMPGPDLDLKDYLMKPEKVDLIKRIIIPASIKWELRE